MATFREKIAAANKKRREARAARAASRKKKMEASSQRLAKRKAASRKTTSTATRKSSPKATPKRGSVDSKTNMDFDAAPRNTNRNPRARNVSMKKDKVGEKKTKGGNFPVYKKKSAAAGSFRSAFATARKAGKKTFTWNGKRYTTKMK